MKQIAYAPRNTQGQFIPAICPECGDQLVFADESNGNEAQWHCTGLVDPNNPCLPLQPCTYTLGSHFQESSTGLRNLSEVKYG